MSLLQLQTSFIPKLHIINTSLPRRRKLFPIIAAAQRPDPPDSKPNPKRRPAKPKPPPQNDAASTLPGMVPRKPRRGRRSEAQAVEDQVRATLEKTLASIREHNPEIFENKPNFFKERIQNDNDSGDDDEAAAAAGEEEKSEEMVVEEESEDWPLDAEVGWGIRASEYFEKHSIKNVVGEDGFEIDWEGEVDDNWVKEINCLEWESFAFHPSPLVILVFERYKRASDNWKTLKELEKAVKVYWDAKDRLPPRSVKIDINIEKDLAYALQVKEGPEILFLRGHRLLYREKEFRTSDELVHMIAHFYYNAKRPSWVDGSSVSRPY